MPVTPTYPGIYIQELPTTAHTITPAPTAITAFVGYTHPFKTKQANYARAVEIFSPSDYEAEFGGMFSVDWLADDVGKAVYQFFLNGGTDAFVVAIQAKSLYDYTSKTVLQAIEQPILTMSGPNPPGPAGSAIAFTGWEPADEAHPITVAISNMRNTQGADADTADVIVAYRSRAETYRGVVLGSDPSKTNIEQRIGTVANPVSSLVTVTHPAGGSYPSAWPTLALAPMPLDPGLPGAPYTAYRPPDFVQPFEVDQPLDKVPVFNQLLTPGVWDFLVVSDALAFCERKMAFFIMDPPADAVADLTGSPLPMIGDIASGNAPPLSIPKSINGAVYFPYLRSSDPLTGDPLTLPPGGFVAGIFAKQDTNRGVWKAPAGLEAVVQNTRGVVPTGIVTDGRQGVLNPLGVNCLRGFPGVGTVVYGARTLVAANLALQQDRYVPVRRMTLFLELSLKLNLGWVVFESNDTPLWNAIRTEIEAFMLGLFNQGAFQGSTPSQAFQVKCDSTTTTQADIDNGIVKIVVAFAPLKPAEFVVIKIAQLAGQPQS